MPEPTHTHALHRPAAAGTSPAHKKGIPPPAVSLAVKTDVRRPGANEGGRRRRTAPGLQPAKPAVRTTEKLYQPATKVGWAAPFRRPAAAKVPPVRRRFAKEARSNWRLHGCKLKLTSRIVTAWRIARRIEERSPILRPWEHAHLQRPGSLSLSWPVLKCAGQWFLDSFQTPSGTRAGSAAGQSQPQQHGVDSAGHGRPRACASRSPPHP